MTVKRNPVEIDGIWYESQSAAAEARGVSRQAIWQKTHWQRIKNKRKQRNTPIEIAVVDFISKRKKWSRPSRKKAAAIFRQGWRDCLDNKECPYTTNELATIWQQGFFACTDYEDARSRSADNEQRKTQS